MTQTITLSVPDISCQHCVQTVQGVANRQPGVIAANADVSSHQVTIELDPQVASVERIQSALAEAGYPASL